jgi:hypothetical protein
MVIVLGSELSEPLGFVRRQAGPPPVLKARIALMLILADFPVHFAIGWGFFVRIFIGEFNP